MRKILIFSTLFIVLTSCGGSGSTDNNAVAGDTGNAAGMTNPTAIDTTKHPDGIVNGSVISTDTAAMNMQNSVNKGKQAKMNK